MRSAPTGALAYAVQGHDLVTAAFEERLFARALPRLLAHAGGGDVLELGCGDGLAARLIGPRPRRYLGVDLAPPDGDAFVAHDLRDGLGPVGSRPFDLYLGIFGVASHLGPDELRRLLREISSHARSGAVVALEALGLRSLEWPGLWNTRPGAGRVVPYRLAADVLVHPWAPNELFGLFADAGIRPLRALDRTIQAGPKCGEGRYWPGLPDLRGALNALLAGASAGCGHAVLPGALARDGRAVLAGGGRARLAGTPTENARAALAAPLGPLPAGDAALIHHALAARRRELLRLPLAGRTLADALWALEPSTGGGYGHGLLVVGRVA